MARGNDERKQIAVVTYPGMTMLELIGTVSALDGLGMKTGFRPVTVAERQEPVETDTPMRALPKATFDDVRRPYGLLVPGGSFIGTIRAMGDEKLLAYVHAAAQSADLVASVGTGSLILAAAGLLTGKRATTHWAYRRILENLGASYIQRRWVEDGRFITSGGTSGGIDMALHLVAKDSAERAAKQVQLWIEYDPQPPFGNIDWRNVDEDALAPVLVRHDAEIERALSYRPDLLEAVRNAAQPTHRASISL